MSIQCLVCNTNNSVSAQQCVGCGSELLSDSSNNSATSYHLRSGTTLKQGDYKIDKLLGEGGFGITYKGTYTKNNAPVAIKEMWPEKAARKGTVSIWPPSISPQHKSQQLSKFKVEASNQQKCDHPNIAQVYDWFDENDTCYIVMEFIQGKSLLSILESRGYLTEQEVVRYFSQVVLALKTIHSNNFLHRDIKPENILIDSQDRAVLIDFGAAREFMSNQSVQMTQVLTPGYAPYEQYSRTGKRGPSTDFYALFASMYELLTGKVPVDAPDRAASVVNKSPDPLIPPRQINPQISASMQQAILKGMRIRADERFQTADEVLTAISPSSRVEIPVDRHIYSDYLPAGTQLKNGQYKIEKLIGEGDFDITYQGIALSNSAPVAIKEIWLGKSTRNGTQVMWPSGITPQQRLQQISQFKLEASNQQKCNHPNIAQVYDWFDENNTSYIVMELIQGQSLLSILESRGRLTEQEVIRYLSQIVSALKIVHGLDILHFNINLENILINSSNKAILTSFIGAKEYISHSLFDYQEKVYISPYIAPELFGSQANFSNAKASTDFYALFVCIYELLTGKAPAFFDEFPYNLIPPRQINPQISTSIEQAILTGMQKRPKKRFQTADEVLEAITPLTNRVSINKHINHNLLNTSSKQARLICKQPNAPVPEFAIGDDAIIGVFDPGANSTDINLGKFFGNETISRKHAEIFNEAGIWKIKDLGSSNGVFIKAAGQARFNARITAPTAINDGDEIAIAKVIFQFRTS